jgi:hypothetical protein
MAFSRSARLRVGVALALAIAPASLTAQRRVTLSPGIALGEAFNVAGAGLVHGRHALLTLDVEAARVPVRLRAEAMAALSQGHGPVSLGASIVFPLGRGQLRPYALAGAGVYGVGGVGHPIGWSAGAGAEYRRRGTTLFLEARRHNRTPSGVSIGLRF